MKRIDKVDYGYKGNNFKDDGFELIPFMTSEYNRSLIKIKNGQLRTSSERFCKNASIFDLNGTKICWGDITPNDVENMCGVYYILSELKSYWMVDKDQIKSSKKGSNIFDPHRKEPTLLTIDYIKKNAIARIVNGKIETNEDLIFQNYQ